MFEHLLVPLDGSALAEAALPAAGLIAGLFQAKVTLIHIVEQDAPRAIHGDRHLTRAQEAQTYLAEVGPKYFPARIQVDHHVHPVAMKDVARGIVLHESELSTDLVVMSTHGRGDLRSLLFGRIAQQVLASGHLPILLIQAGSTPGGKQFACRRVLAPTDAKPSHEIGLNTALDLALAAKAQVILLSVAPTLKTLTGQSAAASRFAPGASQAMLEIAEADMESHLRSQAARFQQAGVAADYRLERGDPAARISAVADLLDTDLIVLGTHGKSGTEAFWTQSVGARVLAQTKRPLLLIPI